MSKKQSIKVLGFFVIILTITFGSVTWYVGERLKADYEDNIQRSLENEWTLLRNALDLYLNQAKSDGETHVAIVEELIDCEFSGDLNAIAYALDNYNEPGNKIRTILTETLAGSYFEDIESDNTDPFIVRGNYVKLDSSSNCASYGESRTVDDEYTMHANPYLARVAFERIIRADIDDMSKGASERPIFFQFLSHPDGDPTIQDKYAEQYGVTIPIEHRNKLSQELVSYDMEGLKEYFMRTGSWKDTFYAYEFITPTYIYNKADLAGRPYVLDGKHTGHTRLSVNVVFNYKNVIENGGSNLEKDLTRFELERAQIKKSYLSSESGLYFMIILLVVICYMAMLYANKLSQEVRNDDRYNVPESV